MARAARLSGAEPDDEEYQEFEEMLEHAEAAQVRTLQNIRMRLIITKHSKIKMQQKTVPLKQTCKKAANVTLWGAAHRLEKNLHWIQRCRENQTIIYSSLRQGYVNVDKKIKANNNFYKYKKVLQIWQKKY